MDVANRKLENSILAFISIVFLIWSAAFIYRSSFIAVDGKRYYCLFDDAMISMRYAWNFSHGLGLVWNQGEYIQGYTNLLMTLLMSLATLAFDKSTAVLFMQLLGVVFMLAIAYVNMQITDYVIPRQHHQSRMFIRVLSFFGALSYYPLVYWSLMGMETGLLALLLLLGILFAFNYARNNTFSNLYLVSGFLGLAYLTRNDTVIFAALIWAYIAFETFFPMSKANQKSLRQLLMVISLYALFVVGQLIFQYLYYGDMLPNTYTLKLIGIPLLERILNGVGFTTPFLIVSAYILVLAGTELIFDFQKSKLLLISMFFSALGYQIYIGGDAWNYWRIMSPIMPLLITIFIIAVNTIVLAVSNTQVFRVKIRAVLLILIGLALVNASFLREILLLNKPYQAYNNQYNINTALVLNKLTTSDATVGVFWAGSIPYFTDRKAIDFLGKSDRYIAKLPPDTSGSVSWFGMNSVPGHNKYDLNYSIKTFEPTYVQGFKWGTQDLTQWAETKYVIIEYDGVSLFLLKDSPAVLWNKINAP